MIRSLKKTLLLAQILTLGMSIPSWGQKQVNHWVDSVYQSLTPAQRIAQLLIVRAYSCNDSVYNDSLCRLIDQFNPGGLCFFKGSPVRQALLTNQLQFSARTPLLISIDAEWGLGMRLDSAFSFPRQMALGAIYDDSLLFRMGQEVGRQCRRMGIQFNFAPVADVNNNPLNPVISFRSFGENPSLVARKSVMYMKGMQQQGIITTAKHFPGHGDTESDSHYSLPLITHNRQRIDSVELFPFRELIRQEVKGMMIGHLYVSCLDSTPNTATTLSPKVVTSLLKEELGFKGYVVTDALDMQGVTKFFKPGEIEVKALLAGNDILLLPQHVEQAVAGIQNAIDSGLLSPAFMEQKCKRILELKYWAGLTSRPIIDTCGLIRDINPPAAEALAREMIRESMTLVRNPLRLIPLASLDRRKIALLSVGDTSFTVFRSTINKYVYTTCVSVPRNFPDTLKDSIVRILQDFDIVIVAVHGITSNAADQYGITGPMLALIDTVVKANRSILVNFGTPYALNRIKSAVRAESILIAYQDNILTQEIAAQAVSGGCAISGKLPVTAGGFSSGTGEMTEQTRLGWVMPDQAGIPGAAMAAIDSIVTRGMEARAFPGCQVLIAKNGNVFYDKAFGNPRYEDTCRVTTNDIYDLASITKIAATTLAVMKLSEQGKISLRDSLGRFLPFLAGSNKSGLLIGDVMAHQAGLQDWIPFYRTTLNGSIPDPAIYQSDSSATFSVRVCRQMYIRQDYPRKVLEEIIQSPVNPDKKSKYSDLGFYLLKVIVENITGQPFDRWLDEQFYRPLGLQTMGFNPVDRFQVSRIMPTEDDEVFRNQVIRGYVHDPGAAMLGGISGHAGLFSNARDLAVIMQMLLNEGSYGGKEYLMPSTVREFTRIWDPVSGNRRGAGFDKPTRIPDQNGPVCPGASPLSFGHSGFTGTYCWADPAKELVYVFLSNRVYPEAKNQKLAEMNIRTNILQAAFDLLQKYHVK